MIMTDYHLDSPSIKYFTMPGCTAFYTLFATPGR